MKRSRAEHLYDCVLVVHGNGVWSRDWSNQYTFSREHTTADNLRVKHIGSTSLTPGLGPRCEAMAPKPMTITALIDIATSHTRYGELCT